MPDIDELLRGFGDGQRLALSRLLSLLFRGEHTHRILAALPEAHAPTIAFTGSAGVGKSTLIGKLIAEIRKDNKKVAVLACDPQSPLSGGALLGDRFRMPGKADDGVFIRSLPALSGHGAVADHLPAMIRLLSAFGFDLILIETVGAGQGDVAVRALADAVVLLLQPETGDDLQWEKAGVLEVADIIAVQKADLPRAEQVAAQVRATLELSGTSSIPVHLVSAKTGQGIPELWQALSSLPAKEQSPTDPNEQLIQLVLDETERRLRGLLHENYSELADVVHKIGEDLIQAEEAADLIWRILARAD